MKKLAKSTVDLAVTQVLYSYIKHSNKLLHMDLSNTLLAERAVYYIIKRLAKSLTIQSVHFSGVLDQLSGNTKAYIQTMLSPSDLRGHSHAKDYWAKPKPEASKDPSNLEPRPAKEGMEDEADPAINDAILDRLIMNFNKEHLQEQLRAEGNRGVSYSESAGSKYVLQRILGHPEIDSCETQENQATLSAIIRDNAARPALAYDPTDQLSVNKQFSRWFISEQCWMCDKFRYFMPVFL